MIINHSKEFIFFANRKTASTSAAIALSSSCNRKDVITPLGRDEKIRRELGYQKPINYIPWRNKISYFAIEAKGRLLKKGVNRELKSIGLRTHIGAHEALNKNYISASLLSEYYSFCFIRNPWDHALSQFFELKKDQKRHKNLDLDTFIKDGLLEEFAISCRSIYSHEGDILVKHLFRYEQLQEIIENIFKELQLAGNPKLPRAKSTLRTDKRSYRQILNTTQQKSIESIFAQEIELGEYLF